MLDSPRRLADRRASFYVCFRAELVRSEIPMMILEAFIYELAVSLIISLME